MTITGGFGAIIDLETGRSRSWYMRADGVRCWVDDHHPVDVNRSLYERAKEHAQKHASLSYVARKTGVGFKTARTLLDCMVDEGIIPGYSGRPDQGPPEEITGVAIQYNGLWVMPKPNRHHHIIRAIGGISGPDVQGFFTSHGRFLDRREAFVLASANGQLNRRPGPEHYRGDQLFSEDLW